MAIEVQAKVGPIVAADGTLADPRLGRAGETVTQDCHARFYEAAYRGKMFMASTDVAGYTHGTALGTAAPLAIWNPTNSGINAVITKAYLGYVSGTLGSSQLVWCTYPQGATVPGGTAVTPLCSQIGNPTSGQIKAYKQTSISASTCTLVRHSMIINPFLASTAQLNPLMMDPVDGDLILTPGNVLSIQGVGGGGSSPLIMIAFVWEEVPV